jgi:hypothetical protein
MGVVTLVMIAGTLGIVGYFRWEQKSKLSSEITQLQQESSKARKEADDVIRLNEETKLKRDALFADVEKLKSEETQVRLQVKNSTDTITAMDQVRTKAQEDVGKLQDIQEKNRFKLLQGQGKAIFVEIPENSKPFTYQGKNYIKVQE